MKLIASPTERTTAATDLGIAVLAGAFAADLIARPGPDRPRAGLWAAAFGALTGAGALGAFAHGVELSADEKAAIWRPLNLCLGLTIALFAGGAIHDGWGRRAALRALPPLLMVGVGFFGLTQVVRRGFIMFVLYEAVALLFALGVYARLAGTGRLAGASLIAAGILVTIIAAAVQASPLKATILGQPFDHNGLFHLIQIAGLPLIVRGLRAG